MTSEKKNPFHQRQKGESIAYDGGVKPIPLVYVSQEWPDKLTLKIKASSLADSSGGEPAWLLMAGIVKTLSPRTWG